MKNISGFQNTKPTRRLFQKELSCSREMFVPFEKMISLQKLVLANPVQMVVYERVTKGDPGRGTVADPKHNTIYRSVPVQSKLWRCSLWFLVLKLHQLGTKLELHLWYIPGCVAYALSLAILGHGPYSGGSGKLKILASLGILLEMQG